MRKVLVVTESKAGNLRGVSLESLSAAQRIAEGGEIIAVAFGSDASHYAHVLGKHGANKVYIVGNQELDVFTTDAYSQSLRQVIDEVKPEAILMPHTAIGSILHRALQLVWSWDLYLTSLMFSWSMMMLSLHVLFFPEKRLRKRK